VRPASGCAHALKRGLPRVPNNPFKRRELFDFQRGPAERRSGPRHNRDPICNISGLPLQSGGSLFDAYSHSIRRPTRRFWRPRGR
jgi:hypothetical protein